MSNIMLSCLPEKNNSRTYTTMIFFLITCKVRVFRFSVSCLLLFLLPSPSPSFSSVLSSFLSSSNGPSLLVPARPHPPTATPSVPRRTSTTNIHASFPCRTSTATSHSQCPTRNLHHDHLCPVSPAESQPPPSTPSFPCQASTAIAAKCAQLHRIHQNPNAVCTGTHKKCQRMLNGMSDRISKYISVRIECQMETYVLTCPDVSWWKSSVLHKSMQ